MFSFLSPWLLVLLSQGCLGQETVKYDDPRVQWEPKLSSDLQQCLDDDDDRDHSDEDNKCEGRWFEVGPAFHKLDLAIPGSGAWMSLNQTKVSVTFTGSQLLISGGSLTKHPPWLSWSPTGNVSVNVNIDNTSYPNFEFPSIAVKTPIHDPIDPGTHLLEMDFSQVQNAGIYINNFVIQNHPAPDTPPPVKSTTTLTYPATTIAPLPTPTNSMETTTAGDRTPTSLSTLSSDTRSPSSTSMESRASMPVATSTPIATASSRNSSDQNNAAHIVGLVLGVFAAVIAVCAIVFCLIRRYRRKKVDDIPAIEVQAQNSKLSLAESVTGASRPPSANLLTFLNHARATTKASASYPFSRRVSSTASSHDPPVPRIPGVSPYTYERPVPYPESSIDSASHVGGLTDAAEEPPRLPYLAKLKVPKVKREISFSAPRVLRVLNPDHGSNASTTGDTEKSK